MLNDIFRSFFRTIGRILAYLVIGGLIAYLLSFVNIATANAAISDLVNSGDSLKGRVSIGSQKVGANYYYSFNDNAYDQSILNLDIPIKYMYGLSSNASGSGTGTIDVGFQVDYCVNNPNAGVENIYSYYENSVDFTYNNGTKMYLAEADWTQSSCFTSFVKLKLNYSLNYGVSDPSTSFTQLTDRDNTFAVHNTFGYVGIIRYIDMIYLDEDDYNQRLEEAKSIYTQQNQNQEIIDSQNQTNEKLDELNDSINGESEDTTSKSCGIICKLKGIFTGIIELPTKLVSLLIDALKSLIVPDDMDFINDFVESIENKLGFIAAIPVQIIEFGLDLATASWEDITSVSLPSISIFGYSFWNAQEVDISEGLAIFQTFRYVTDALCVVICAKGLIKLWENFTGGGSS